MIRVVTDSVSDIPKELAAELNIEVLPLIVNFGEKSYRDGVDLTSEDFFQLMKETSILPTTSQVAPGDFIRVFEDNIQKGNSVIVILISSQLSGTFSSAVAARKIVERGDIEIIDSQGVTFGQGLIVVEAARMAKKGCGKEEILKRVLYMKDHMQYKFVLDTLEYLHKGGRLSATSAFVGNLLNIKPILTVKDGKLVLEDKVRGRKKALKWLTDWIESNNIDLSNQTIGINHSNDEAFAHELIEIIKHKYEVKEIITSKVGCVVGTHAGPGAVAMYCLKE